VSTKDLELKRSKPVWYKAFFGKNKRRLLRDAFQQALRRMGNFEVKYIVWIGYNCGEDTLNETIKANRRTAEYRISNVEGWVRFAQSFIK
jgi:hypothetical protein